MANIMEIIVKAVDQASGVLDNIGKTGSQATKNLEESFNNAGKAMEGTGKSLSKGLTAPLVGVGTAAVMTVAKFDDSMSQVQALSGATGKELDSLRGMAKDLGATTAHSASDAADAMGYLALAGYDTNQILEATPHMLDLASAGGMELAQTADIVTDSMSGFGMEADRAGEAADVFAKAQSITNTSVDQLGEAMKYASSTANAAGMDIQKTSAVLGMFANAGIKGGMAGTTFNAMLRDLKKANEEGKLAIDGTNIALYNQDGSMRDIGAVMADVEKATKGMTTAQRDAALGAIFGEQSIRGANIMLEQGSEKYKELEQAMYDSNGTAEEMAGIMEDNVAGAFRALKSQTEGILIQLGEQLAPIIKDTIIPLVQSFGDRISGLIEWFAGLDDGTQKTILTILGIAAAIGPVLIILGKVVGAVGTMIGVFGKLRGAFTAVTGVTKIFNATLLANPITWIIAAIAALIAVIVLLWKNWDEVSEWLAESWEWIKEKATAIFESLAEFFSAVWEGIKEVSIAVWEAITEFLSSIWEGIKDVATAVWESISEFMSGIWEGMKEIASTVFGALADFFSSIWETIKQTFSTVLEAIKNVVSTVWEGIKTLTSTVWEGIKGSISSIIESIKSVISSVFNAIKSIISSIWNSVKSVTSSVWNGIKSVMTNIINGIRNVISSSFNNIKNIITNVWNGVKNTTKSIWDSMVTIIKAPINGIIGLINGMIGALNRVKINIPKVPDWIPGIGGKGGGSIGFNIPRIPHLARGGFIKGGNPTPAVIGEGRYDEAVIPLNETVLGKLAEMIASRMGTSKATEHRHSGTIRVIVENAQQGFEEIVDVVINEIRREVRA